MPRPPSRSLQAATTTDASSFPAHAVDRQPPRLLPFQVRPLPQSPPPSSPPPISLSVTSPGRRQAVHGPCRALPPSSLPLETRQEAYRAPVVRRSAGKGPRAPATPLRPDLSLCLSSAGVCPPTIVLSPDGKGSAPADSQSSAGVRPPTVSVLSAGERPLPIRCCRQGLAPCRFAAIGRGATPAALVWSVGASPLPIRCCRQWLAPLPLRCCRQGCDPCHFSAVCRG
jgi:hypothetical protein